MAGHRRLPVLIFLLAGAFAQKIPTQVHIAYADESDAMTVTWSTVEDSKESIVEYGPVLDDHHKVVRSVPDQLATGEIAKSDSEQTASGNSSNMVRSELAEAEQATTLPPPTVTEPPANVYKVQGTSVQLTPFLISRQYIHKAKMVNLEPSQKYWYRVGGPANGWSSIFFFKTNPLGNDWSPKVTIYGDLGYSNAKIFNRILKESQEGNMDVILHAGDLGYDLHSEEGRVGDRFLEMIEPVAAAVPYMVTPGNHESFRNFSNYKSRFWMPGNHENMMYTFKVGPLLVISLSTEVYYFLEYGGVQPASWQYTWLESVLKEANKPENRRKQPWIILMGHRPMYCSNDAIRNCNTGSTRVRTGGTFCRGKGIEKLLYDYGVDLTFSGHMHSYERLWPTYDKEIYNGSLSEPYVNPRAPVHFIVGCAGNKEYRHSFLDPPPKWNAQKSRIYGFVQLTVANKTHVEVRYESHDPKAPTIDEIWVVKDAHGPYPRLFPLDATARSRNLQQKGNRKRKFKIAG